MNHSSLALLISLIWRCFHFVPWGCPFFKKRRAIYLKFTLLPSFPKYSMVECWKRHISCSVCQTLKTSLKWHLERYFGPPEQEILQSLVHLLIQSAYYVGARCAKFLSPEIQTFISWIKTSTRHTFEHVKTNLCHISLRFSIGRKNKQNQKFFSG